jgi:hypothetical protein
MCALAHRISRFTGIWSVFTGLRPAQRARQSARREYGTSQPLGAHVNSKSFVTTVLAMFLAAGGLAFAQGNGDRNDSSRNEPLQLGAQQDPNNDEVLQLNPPENQGFALDGSVTMNAAQARTMHTTGAIAFRPTNATGNMWWMTGAATA